MKLIRKNNKKGFTLVELIVVIAIIAILALILIPAITGYTKKADQAALQASARALHTKAVMHYSEYGEKVNSEGKTLKAVLEEDADDKVDVGDVSFDDGFEFKVSYKGYNVIVTDKGLDEVTPTS